jgi:hypothetical protein
LVQEVLPILIVTIIIGDTIRSWAWILYNAFHRIFQLGYARGQLGIFIKKSCKIEAGNLIRAIIRGEINDPCILAACPTCGDITKTNFRIVK